MEKPLTTRYPGAQPFGDDPLSRKLFHGREQEARTLTQQILAHRLVVLFSRSGLGKTSLLRAAVGHGLRAEGLIPLIVRVDDRVAGPFASVYRDIEAECACQGVSCHPGDKSSLWSYFKTTQFWNGDALLEPAFMIDQFEELFTLHGADVRGEFMDQLSYVIRGVPPTKLVCECAVRPNDSPPPIRIVLSLREDFLPYLEEFSDRIPEILAERFRLLPLSRESARRAIEQPSALEDSLLTTPPFKLQAQATEAILSFLERRAAASQWRTGDRVEPFQLQLICQHIERLAKQKAEASRHPATVSLEDIGGERGLYRVLRGFYKQQIAAIPSILERRRVKRLCSEFLISMQGRRLKLEESEIQRLTGVRPAILRALVSSRLLRVDQCATGSYYELSHDSLIAPVFHSRHLWFVLRTLVLGIGVSTGVVMASLLVLGLVGIPLPLGSLARGELLLAFASILLLLALYVRRTLPLLRQMWHRSMM